MWTLRSGRLAAVVAVVVALGILVVPASASGAPAPPPVARGTTAGAGWDVTPAGTGSWVVRLTLPTAVPIRAALPQLAVDGDVVGVATQDPDGHTLRVRTTASGVTRARKVELAWNGVVTGTLPSGQRADGPVTLPAQTGPLLAEDPTAAAKYAVKRADYDLGDTAVRLPGLAGQAVELRAAVYLPAGAPGRRPVVVFLHGRHQPCYGDPDDDGSSQAWPCPAGTRPIPSHLGYGKAAEALAAAGDVVVSISADGINALDYAATDGGAQARGELVLAHLDRLAAWNAGQGPGGQGAALVGRLDLTNIGLMGHSRGGEGVVKAALLNAERPSPYGIRAVMPLAPVDFLRSTLPGVPMAVVLPYCDGDVNDQQGQHFYDDSRYGATDDVLRTSLLVMGANHNYFNSEWTPGTSVAPSFDDWYDDADPVCGRQAPSRLTPAEQRAVGAAYISGFFRLHLGGERQFLPLFDGTGGRAASVARAVVYTEAQQPRSARADLGALQARTGSVRTSAGASYCVSWAEPVAGVRAPCALTSRNPATLPHWTPAYLAQDVPATPVARMTWGYYGSPQQQIAVDVTRATGRRDALTFRAATALATASDLVVTLADTAGHRASVQVSRVSSALSPLPALGGFDSAPVAKVWMRTVRLPLTGFAGVDPARLATVTFASAGPTGSVYLSDVALDTPAPGAGGPSSLPAMSVADADVFVGDKPSRAAVVVSLSRASAVPVTAKLEIGAAFGGGQVTAHAVTVTVPAGVTTVRVPFAVSPSEGGDGGGYGTYLTCLAVPVNAFVGDGLGTLNVYG